MTTSKDEPTTSAAAPQARTRSIQQAIESRCREVDLARLAARRRTARIVSMDSLQSILCEVVENILLSGDIDPLLDRESLQKQTQSEMRRLFELHQKTIADKGEAEKARVTLEKQVSQLRTELGRQVERLEEEKNREPHLSSAALEAMEEQVKEVFRSLAEVDPGREGGSGHVAEAERKLLELFDTTLRREQDRLLAHTKEARASEVDRLERRIAKLNKALRSTEDSLADLARAKGFDPGVASIYKDLQGLRGDEQDYERKMELIRVVFVNNLLLQKRGVTEKDMDGIPEDQILDLAGNEPGPTAGRAGGAMTFQEPVEPLTDETSF